MKIAITVDDVQTTKYTLGRWDFYTRQMDLDDAIVAKLQKIEELNTVAQRVLAAVYNSHGKFILPEDLKVIECLSLTVTDPATLEAQSEKQRKPRGFAVPSSKESQTG